VEDNGIRVFLSNADRNDGFFKEYIENYRDLSLDDLEHEILNKAYLSNQADKMMAYCDRNPRSILEVGVGQGILLRKLRGIYPKARITAIDISIPFLKHVQSGADVECMVANAENLPFKEEFDLVIASDILEHVINPIDFLLSANYSLRPTGSLLLRVPFEDNMLQYSRLLGAKYKFAHLRNFSKRNLLLLLNQAGFETERTYFDGYYAYRRRSLFNKGVPRKLFERYIQWRYPDEDDVSTIPSWIGGMLMKPSEIVVSAKKIHTVTKMDYPI
jgi:2-polyprenyl-3-methyl-5-hydroxy-6-metoxy-1,4-benzoquinol methylase